MPEALADIGKDVRHTDGQGDGAPRAMSDVQSDQLTEDRQINDGQLQFRIDGRRSIDGEIVVRIEGDGGEKSHDADKTFHQHGTVAYKFNLRFVFNHLWRRPGTDEGMEPRNGAAGDGNEHIGPPGTGDDGSAAVHELGCERHLNSGIHEEHADRQGADDADLHEGAEIVPRGEQEPDRNSRRTETIDGQQDGNLFFTEGKPDGITGFGNIGTQ